MRPTSQLPIRVVCWIISIYHLAAGVAATFFGETAVEMGSLLFGVKITMDGQTELLVRYLGAFALSFGVLMGFAALNPLDNRKIIYGAVVYFAVRAFDRIAFADLLAQHSDSPMPNWGRIVVISLMAVALLVLMPRGRSSTARD